jgi:hypothetical protein
MARKRIYSDGPLTAAEKQQRYRNRTKDETRAATKEIIGKEGEELRENLHRYINGLSYVELFDLAQAIINPGPKQFVTLEELSALSGIPEHELKSLSTTSRNVTCLRSVEMSHWLCSLLEFMVLCIC